MHDLRAQLTSDDTWVWLKRRVDLAVSDGFGTCTCAGIGMLPETKRVYPVQGISPRHDPGGAGHRLRRTWTGWASTASSPPRTTCWPACPARSRAQEDVIGRQIADSVYELQQPVDGSDLRLTIDAGLQHLLEAAMWGTYRRTRRQGVTGVVMDVKTGAILALATFPSYDANKYATTDRELFTNPAVARQYEPGSVMKAFTIAAALDAGAITTKDKFMDNNNLRHRRRPYPECRPLHLTLRPRPDHRGDVLKLSNNVGAAKIGLTLGRAGLYEAFRRFGFGEPTGIDIAGEARGRGLEPRRPERLGGPDRRPERVRPGPEP